MIHIVEGIQMPINKKQTSPQVVSKASKALQEGRTSKNTKSIAGSALSQTKPNQHPRKSD